jgi:hypothetical protein
MNGGAWLTVDGVRVDLLYRDLLDVERWTAEAREGRWELFRVPGYLAGFPSYTLAAELALGVWLAGTLPRPSYPAALCELAPARWRWEAAFAPDAPSSHADRGDVAACFGKLSLAVLAEGHARAAESAMWVVNEKGLTDRTGLAHIEADLLRTGRTSDLASLVGAVRSRIAPG